MDKRMPNISRQWDTSRQANRAGQCEEDAAGYRPTRCNNRIWLGACVPGDTPRGVGRPRFAPRVAPFEATLAVHADTKQGWAGCRSVSHLAEVALRANELDACSLDSDRVCKRGSMASWCNQATTRSCTSLSRMIVSSTAVRSR